jgi:hypothetical protein
MRKIIALVLSLGLLFQQVSFAETITQLNLSNLLNRAPAPLAAGGFQPPHLRYFAYDYLEDKFQLLLDRGSQNSLSPEELVKEGQEAFNYFLIGLSLPNSSFWVNLRPDSPGQIIDEYLEQTEVGRIFLEADVQLKKDTALFTSPETPVGKEYWDRLYAKAGEIFGQENISIPTLTRPWIVPGEIIIRYTDSSAYLYKATLKVMLEQDYLSSEGGVVRGEGKGLEIYAFKDPRLKELNEYSSELIRELVIPLITKEVNTSQRYVELRQVYYSLVLAQWYKRFFAGSDTAYGKLIDSADLNGLYSSESWSKNTYFEQYQESFTKGEYNLKAPARSLSAQTIRSYFSGGVAVTQAAVTQAVAVPAVAAPPVADAAKATGAVQLQVGPDGMVVQPAKPADSAAGFEGRSNEDYNASLNAAIRPPRLFSFARKITIPYARDNAVFRTAEGRRNVKLHMREVLDQVEENVLTVVFGKEFEGGKQVVKRGSADANMGWTDCIRELDPEGAKYLMAQVEYTQKGFEALMKGDYVAAANYANLYVKSRSDTSKRWLSLMLLARKGQEGLPRWVYGVYKMIMDNPKEYENFIHLFEDIDAGRSSVDYDLYAPGEIGIAMRAALEFNASHAGEGKAVGVFALGAGGAGSVCALVGTSRAVCLEFLQFLKERHGIVVPRLVTSGGAQAAEGENVITTSEVDDLTTGKEGTKYATGRHRLAFWVSAKADVDGVKIDLEQLNEAPILKERELKLEPPAPLPWVLVNRNDPRITLPIEQAIDEDGNVKAEYPKKEWAVVKDWRLDFDHNKYFRLDRPILSEENMQLIRERIAKNGFTDVFPLLWKWAKDNNKKLFISVPSRWLDIWGSSWDLKDFRLSGTPEGDLRLEFLPSCNAIPSEYRLDIEISATGDADILEYEAPQYFKGVHRVNPNKVEYLEKDQQPQDPEALLFVRHAKPDLAAQGIWMLKRKEPDIPALFARLFGVKGGVRFKCTRMDTVPRQGGMESGNALVDASTAVFSMITGAKFSTAEVSYISHVAQMNETNTITGNQGADAAWAGAGLHVYLGGIYDMQAKRPFAAVSLDTGGKAEQTALPYAMWHPVWGGNHNKVTNTVPGTIPVQQQAIQLTTEQLQVLQAAIKTLPVAIREILESNALIFLSFGEGKTAHRSLGRRQIEIDISLLAKGKENELTARLWHDALEQQAIIFSLRELGLSDEFSKTLLDPQARETKLVKVGGQQIALADVIDNLSKRIHQLLVEPAVIELMPDSPEALFNFGEGNSRFITFNLAAYLSHSAYPGEFLANNRISDEQLRRAALRINLVLAALQGVELSQVPVPVDLADIHTAFAPAGQDVKRFIAMGGLPVPDDWKAGGVKVRPRKAIPRLQLPPKPTAPKDTGGIDFRFTDMSAQAGLQSLKRQFSLPPLNSLRKIDLNREQQDLERLMGIGTIPASQRIIEYVSACQAAGSLQLAVDAFSCLVGYFRLQERLGIDSDSSIRAFLLLAESGQLFSP